MQIWFLTTKIGDSMKLQWALLVAATIILAGCIDLDTFVEIGQNESYVPLEKEDALTSAEKKAIDDYIKDATYFDAAVALKGDKLIYQYGETNIPMNCASVRKSVFSALYGIAENRGIVDLDATLAEMGIDDEKNPLTETEKTATIRDLLQARSGIYLPAAGESEGMKERKPERGEYLPGKHFYYNNWDINILPIIIENLTGKEIGELIYEWLAEPTNMKTFSSDDVTYQYIDETEYPQTRVYISAEDLARIGALYLNQGKWKGEQIIPADWVETSVKAVSKQPEDADLLENELMEGYAYLWWVDDDENAFWADGSGGQFLIVDRARNLTVALRNNTGMSTASYLLYEATERYESNIDGNEVYKLIRSKIK